jgi:cell division protein FtsB
MKNRSVEKYILFFFCGLLVAAGLFFFVLFGKTYREYTNVKSREIDYQQKLAEMEAQLKEKEETLHRLRHDPAFVERMIRQRLGYAKPDELVFRFEDVEESLPPPLPPSPDR